MNAKEVIEIVKESNLWEPLTEEQKKKLITNHVLTSSQPLKQADTEDIVGEVYLGP